MPFKESRELQWSRFFFFNVYLFNSKPAGQTSRRQKVWYQGSMTAPPSPFLSKYDRLHALISGRAETHIIHPHSSAGGCAHALGTSGLGGLEHLGPPWHQQHALRRRGARRARKAARGTRTPTENMRVHAPSCSQSAPALPEEAERALQAWVIMAVCWGLVGVAMVRNGEPRGGNA